jgi:hypothetical protein
MTEIRNQLKSQSLGDVAPSSLLQVGGAIFPDDAAVTNMLDFQQIVKAFQAVHSLAYGQPIAGTNAVGQGTGQGAMLSTSNDNEVYRIDSIFLNNSGGAAPITAILKLGDAPINSTMDSMNNAVLQPTGNAITMGPFFMDSNTPLTVTVIDGTASELEWFVKYSKISQ